MTTTDIKNPETLVRIPVQDWMKSKGFVSVHKSVRTNENGYPYVTFINADNKAENIYFSKSASENYSTGTPIQKGFFDKLNIADTTNAAGEIRTKLVSTEGLRVTMEDLF